MTLRTRWRGIAVAVLLALPGTLTSDGQTKLVDSGNVQAVERSGTTGAGAQDEKAGAASGKADGQETFRLGGDRRPLYRLTRGDVLDVNFILSPEYDQQVTVLPDGYVLLKDAGMVNARGLTLDEFITAVTRAYRGYLHDPKVSITLKDFERPYFVAGGELARPGKYDLRSDTTVLEAVEMAGGFTERAKHSQVVLFRKLNEDRFEARLLNMKKMLAQRDLNENPQLQPGDLVFVPQNTFSKIAPFLTRPGVGMYISPTQF